jgi:decaprenylphospho-beta-D-ribofuranose 2-oxidase
MPDIDAFLDAADDAIDAGVPAFWFGWIDALARGAGMGRGILETGEYSASDDDAVQMPKEFVFRFNLPRMALHPMIIARYNERRFHRVPAAGLRMNQSLEQFFFPLDHLVNFNKVYGRSGFYSFHCGIPQGNHEGVRQLLGAICAARAGSMAAVLKPMGGPGEGMMSFPLRGYALAVDTPRRSGTEALYARLERMVLQHGGRIYAAKDALMSAQGYRQMFPELENFRKVLRQVDPGGRFQSDMSRRLAIRPELGGM